MKIRSRVKKMLVRRAAIQCGESNVAKSSIALRIGSRSFLKALAIKMMIRALDTNADRIIKQTRSHGKLGSLLRIWISIAAP
jgi:hypothetical protein